MVGVMVHTMVTTHELHDLKEIDIALIQAHPLSILSLVTPGVVVHRLLPLAQAGVYYALDSKGGVNMDSIQCSNQYEATRVCVVLQGRRNRSGRPGGCRTNI